MIIVAASALILGLRSGLGTRAFQYNTCSDPRQLLDSVRRLSSMVGELSRPDDRGLGEASAASSSGSGNLGVARLGRMNRQTWEM